ncbi:hypothetical protein AVEN_13190-1 [Araneus ventricosus]|uniref:Uncharacterized protein n=1 Tax=Araneus ventricosus TaxID=182803 RepID=A0A4Y2RP57_ARAVE|nr:hypothetical protein AVEN_13190-1 [Araneus ventricosus]
MPPKPSKKPPPAKTLNDELKELISKFNENDFVDGIDVMIKEKLLKLDEYSDGLISAKTQYSKTLRNQLAGEYIGYFLSIIKDLSKKINELNSNIYDLKGVLTNDDAILNKAKMWTLQKENADLRTKLEITEEISGTINQAFNEVTARQDSYAQGLLQSFKEEFPILLQSEREIACRDFHDKLEVCNTKLVEEVKKEVKTTRTFAQVAQLPGAPSHRSIPLTFTPGLPQDPEGVLLIQPITDIHKDFNRNRALFLGILKENNSVIRVRGVTKLHGGGVKIVTADEAESKLIKQLLLSYDKEKLEDIFEMFIPPRRTPQLILYNVDKEIEMDILKEGLLSKNLFLADENNKPHFRVEFKIPARDKSNNHWVISVNPKKFIEIRDKGGLYFQWVKLRTSEFIGVKQCKQCFGFGHTTKVCDNTGEPKCDRCGETIIGNTRHRCRGFNCINCIQSNARFNTDFGISHSCLDKRCKSFLRQRELIIKRTDYGF